MKTQTTFDDLVLEFPALGKKQGRELKGGEGPGPSGTSSKTGLPFPGGYSNSGGYNTSYNWSFHSFDGNPWVGAASDVSTGGGWDSTQYQYDDSSICYTCYSLDYNRLPKGDGSNTQVKNFCVFKTMEVANHYFGGQTNQGEYLKAFTDTKVQPNMNLEEYMKISEKGFEGTFTELSSLVSKFFHTNNLGTNVEGVKSALANNHPVMATIMLNGSNGHEVLITQCDTNNPFEENNRFTYFDPQEGRYKLGDASIFNGMIEIKGKK